MIVLIILGAAFLSVGMAFTGIPVALTNWINEMGMSPYMLIVVLTLIYIVLGCFLEGTSMIVLTSSVALPMIQSAGLDPIWFGIYLVLVVEMSQITPPVGFNLFVLQSMSGRDILTITKASLPFFFLMLFGLVLITVWPEIATFLPSMMINR